MHRAWTTAAVLVSAGIAGGLIGLAGCVHHAPAGPRPPSLTETFDALIRDGCYLCLRDVVSRYRELPEAARDRPDVRERATRAALLLLLRRHELGLPADAEEAAARELVASDANASVQVAAGLRVLAFLPPNTRGIGEDAADALLPHWPSQEEQDALRQSLAAQRQASELDAYLFLSFVCRFGDPADVSDVANAFAASPLVRYRAATCRDADVPVLRALLAANPRFAEIRYSLGTFETQEGQDTAAAADLDAAWESIPHLTVARLAGAELALRAEDYARALSLVDDLLAVVPGHRRARLVRLQALTYLKRHDEAIALAHELSAGPWYLGDVYYLLAWNEYQTSRIAPALADVQHAGIYESSGRVHTLEGLVRMEQARWSDARDAFKAALAADARGCDAAFYLGHAEARLSARDASAQAFESAARCYGDEAERLQKQAAEIAGADPDAVRRRTRLERKRDEALERQRKARELAAPGPIAQKSE